MKRRPLMIVGGVVGFVVVAAIGWYLASPLFITRSVDEAFPVVASGQGSGASGVGGTQQDEDGMPGGSMPEPTETEEMATATPVPATRESGEAGEAMVEERATATPEPVMEETATPEPTVAAPVAVRQGQFRDADNFHRGSGAATLYQLPDGNHILRFEEFEVTNGPDLHVLLVSNPNPTSSDDKGEYVDLGALKGNVGSQNYDIPAGTDLSQYQSVIIYCVPFRVVFAVATLS